MIKVRKYDRITKTYGKEFELDYAFTNDMDRMVQCPICKKYHKLGETLYAGDYYESRGIWRVTICEDCYDEIEKRKNCIEGLTLRQNDLYAYLSYEQRAYGNDHWTSIEEIIDKLDYDKSSSTSHDPCPMVWSDINAINLNKNVSSIIIIKDFKYKIATNKEEAEEYINKFQKKALKSLNRYWTLKSKISKDKTLAIVINDNGELDLKEIETFKGEN